jgi:hypothetical protein
MNDDPAKNESPFPKWVKNLWWLIFGLIIPIISFFADIGEQRAEEYNQNSTRRAIISTYRSLSTPSSFLINPLATLNAATTPSRSGPSATRQALSTQLYGTLEARYPNFSDILTDETFATPRP